MSRASDDKRLREWLIASLNAGVAAGFITLGRGGEVLERWDELVEQASGRQVDAQEKVST